jgi:uncharacterized protein with PQ loop repeat
VCLVALALAHGVVPSLFVLFSLGGFAWLLYSWLASCINLAHLKKIVLPIHMKSISARS